MITRLALPFQFDPKAPVDEQLENLLTWAETLGVRMLLEFDGPIFISSFGRDVGNSATKGNGRTVLGALFQIADHHGIKVETSYLKEEIALGAYYRSFGFEPDGLNDPDFIINMMRMPMIPA